MLLDEFVDFRVRVGETERQGVERERALRAREHGWWSRSLTRGRRAATGVASAAGEAAVPVDAAQSAGQETAQPAGQRERELAHVGR